MAEVKNAFIKSKMNKDLDDRLLPNGEYRDALNVQVSKSESSDVGALENVLGNSVAFDFGAAVSVPGIKCIGFFVDEFNNDIYSFFTDNTDNSSESTITYNTSANNFIFKHNTNTGDTRALVRGAFLNFSTTSPIIGVNLLEELLFFTDNRNQPRKINVKLANPNANNVNPIYYTSEDQVSVAKYNPYECIRVIKPSAQAGAVILTTTLTAASTTDILVVDSVTGVSIGNGVTGNGVKTGTIVESVNGNNVVVNKAQNLQASDSVNFVGLETSMYDVSTALLPDGVTANPYYDQDFGGDPDFLEDKFVRFSYRFKFDDGEYSIFAPFTQPCFIPKQDGYFINDDEKQAFSSTIVSFMENKVTKIQLQIPLPATATDLVSNTSPFKITAIDILYKESDGLAIQVVDTIEVDAAFSDSAGINNIYEYTYESTKPFKTLPSKELIRVYDKIPVRAFSQEVISNRVVYGNFQDKHTPPAALDYQVRVSDKYDKNSPFSSKTIVEYPSSTVKQNRNYQVGIVLSDKFGRQSSTILSNNTSALTASGFGTSTVFSPYQTISDTAPADWPGESLKILFNSVVPNTKNLLTGAPGLYNGDATSADHNPLGWYSYKVVVQQKEQDYYNVYNAGAMKGNPQDVAQNLNTSYITLINDNINKVPRDLSEVGPLQKQFRSSVRLIGRVENIQYATVAVGNQQFYPGRLTDTTSSIEDLNSLFDVAEITSTIPITSADNPFFPFYKAESDPLVSQITTTQPFGLVNTVGTTPNIYAPIENLAIFETEPDLSRLDFYFETSTSGLISELNIAVATDTGGAFGIDNFNFNQTEADGLGVVVATNFYATDVASSPIDDTEMSLISVVDGAFVDRTGEWTLNALPIVGTRQEYELVTNAYQYYGPGANTNEFYTFTFAVTDNTTLPATVNNVSTTGQLGNINPSIDAGTAQSITSVVGTTGIINTQTATNGSNVSGGNSTANLSWVIVSGSAGIFTIDSTTGAISNSSVSASGVYTVVIRVTDAGGATQDATLTILFGDAPVPGDFIIPEIEVGGDGDNDGSMLTYYFTDPANSSGYQNLDGGNHVLASGYRESNDPTSTPTLASPIKNGYVCTNTVSYPWYKERVGNWFQGNNNAAFYVAVRTRTLLNGTQTNTTVSVEWRNIADGVVDWIQAKDINGEDAKFGATLLQNGGQAQVQYSSLASSALGKLEYKLQAGTVDQYTVLNTQNATEGYRIFAFNGSQNGRVDGEYRITVGNFTGSNLAYSAGNNPCLSASNQVLSRQLIELGDANYGGPNGSSGYTYVVSTNNSDTSCSFNASTTYGVFYAREFIAKYVTQLYTDVAMTQEASFIGSYVRSFRIDGVNQEGYDNGKYLATFDVNGLRTTASVGCLA